MRLGLAAVLGASLLSGGCATMKEVGRVLGEGAVILGQAYICMEMQNREALAVQSQFEMSRDDPEAPGYKITSRVVDNGWDCKRIYIDKRDDERIMRPRRYEARIACHASHSSYDDWTRTEILDAAGFCRTDGFCDVKPLHMYNDADKEGWLSNFMETRDAYIYQERNRR